MRYQLARPELGEPEWQAIREVVESGWVTQGPRVADFERAVAAYCGAPDAVAVSSCTAALHLSLICAGVEPGDEVIVPSMSFIATANAAVHAGATPVFAEVDPVTFNLDVDDVRRRIGPHTRAIVLVHQLGLAADRDAFAALSEQHGLALIDDAACALGTSYRNRPVGVEGDFVCFSFHPRKLLTTGDGGMIVTASREHAARLRRLRHQGMNISDMDRHGAQTVVHEEYAEIGYNYRMTDVQAAMGIAQLRRLPEMVRRRRELAAVYDDALAGQPLIHPPVVPEWCDWNVQTYSVRLEGFGADRRDAVMQSLLDRGIPTRRAVMVAHLEPAYRRRTGVKLPVSEAASAGSLALPLHGGMSPDDCRTVAGALMEAVASVNHVHA